MRSGRHYCTRLCLKFIHLHIHNIGTEVLIGALIFQDITTIYISDVFSCVCGHFFVDYQDTGYARRVLGSMVRVEQ